MEYTKPQIVVSANAITTIQGSPKEFHLMDQNGEDVQTIAAYEADE
jgi:hypothetical protein